MVVHLICTNALSIPLPNESVQCVVTSPPYWGLRFYSGTTKWTGGDPGCDHIAAKLPSRYDYSLANSPIQNGDRKGTDAPRWRSQCPTCGANRVDDQLGSESLHDCLGWATGAMCGECFVCHTMMWTREIWRVLRKDGTLWLNIGDSYNGSGGAGGDYNSGGLRQGQPRYSGRKIKTLKPKDLVGIPFRVALALQADGWTLRSDIIWHKPNTMPSSVTDRPTSAHEYLFLLAKQVRYYCDMYAIREPLAAPSAVSINATNKNSGYGNATYSGFKYSAADYDGRNKRSVWKIPPAPYSGAHFAAFPPDLVEPCIRAGTSERGSCPRCGTPWVRVIESDYEPLGDISSTDKARNNHQGNNKANRKHGRARKLVKTIEWKPGCNCNAGDPIPAIVLDPFAGSGTTCMVANQLGRVGVGLDLSMEYLHLARERTGIKAQEEWVKGKDGTTKLDDLPMFAVKSGDE